MADVAVISFHEKGFWQGDLYKDASEWTWHEWENGAVPDDFFTMRKDNNLSDAKTFAKSRWPDAEIREAAEDEEDEDCDD